MTIAARMLVSLALPLALVGCDKVQGLLGDDSAKTEAKPKADAEENAEAKAESEEKSEAKEAVAAAEPEAKGEAEPEAEAAAAPEADAEPETEAEAEAEPEAEAAGEQPCIVGHWEATDYLAEINRALRKDPTLKSMKYKSKSGTIGYVVEPLGADGKGTVRANADKLSYKYAGKVQGIGVSLGVTMNGDITASYTLEEPSRIVVDKPTSNNMRVSARVTLKGLGKHRDSQKVRHQFDGDFFYECSDEELKVYTDGKDRTPLKFKRLDE